jgi:16S rRNA (uracil1498-N3)-methyltransferase
VGPEGGLTAAELGALDRAGAARASLGPRTLRAETAAIAAVALLQARYGDMG